MISRAIRYGRKIMKKRKDRDEARLRRLEGSILICDAKFGSYLDKIGHDVATLIEKGNFSLSVSLVSENCPVPVIHAVSKKMPVVSIPPGFTFGQAIVEFYGEIETGITILGRVSPATRSRFTAKGIDVFTIEMPESGDTSCTNIAAGIIDAREVIGKYPSRRDHR